MQLGDSSLGRFFQLLDNITLSYADHETFFIKKKMNLNEHTSNSSNSSVDFPRPRSWAMSSIRCTGHLLRWNHERVLPYLNYLEDWENVRLL